MITNFFHVAMTFHILRHRGALNSHAYSLSIQTLVMPKFDYEFDIILAIKHLSCYFHLPLKTGKIVYDFSHNA